MRSAGERAETHEAAVGGVAFAHELADVQLSLGGDFRGTCVTQVRVVRPHHHLGQFPSSAAQVFDERVERVDHVLVAKVPRRRAPAEHRAVVLLCVLHRQRVLLRVEEVLVDRAVQLRILGRVRVQIHELIDHLLFAESPAPNAAAKP